MMMHVFMYVCMYACMHACMYVCINVCACICIYVNMYIYMHTYINICTSYKMTVQLVPMIVVDTPVFIDIMYQRDGSIGDCK